LADQQRYIVIDATDNVATAIADLLAGETLASGRGAIRLTHDIPFGHKFALEPIPRGAYVIKYGAQIGRATAPIATGEHVHVHNVEDIVDEVRKG
jgi:hypothetical protein